MGVLSITQGQDAPAIQDPVKRGEMLDQSLAVMKSACRQLRGSRRTLNFQAVLPYIADFARDLRLWKESGDPQKLPMMQTAAGAILKSFPHEQDKSYGMAVMAGGRQLASSRPLQESGNIRYIGPVQALFSALRLSLRVLIAEFPDLEQGNARDLLSTLEARAKNLGSKTQSQKVRSERDILRTYLAQDRDMAREVAWGVLEHAGR